MKIGKQLLRLLLALPGVFPGVRLAGAEILDADSRGHGVLIALDGEPGLLTCAHVIVSDSPRVLETPVRGTPEEAGLRPGSGPVRFLPRRDLAFLPLAPENGEPATTAAPVLNQPIHGLGRTGRVLELGATEFRTDLEFKPGDSGRGLYDATGKLVGLCRYRLEPEREGEPVRFYALRVDQLRANDFVELPPELPPDTAILRELNQRLAGPSNRDAFFLLTTPTFDTSPEQQSKLQAARRAWCRMAAVCRFAPDPRWRCLRSFTAPGREFDAVAAELESRYGKPLFQIPAETGNDFRALLFRRAFLTLLPSGELWASEYAER